MNKLLGIFSKQKTLKLHHFSSVINCATTPDQINTQKIFLSDRFYLLNYGNPDSSHCFIQTNNMVYAYAGFVYFPFMPKPGKNIHLQTIEYLSKTKQIPTDKNIKGKYNIVKYNKEKQELVLQNDRHGFFPMYIYEDNCFFIFCNDYEPIVHYNNNKYKINKVSVIEYLLAGAPQRNATFFKNIDFMPEGTEIRINKQKCIKRKVFPVITIHKNDNSIETIADQYYQAFKTEYSEMLNWSPDSDITLTGGTDTRMMLGAMSSTQRVQRQFVTWPSKYVSDRENQDIYIAKLLAGHYNLNHRVQMNPFFAIQVPDRFYFKNIKEKTHDYIISGYLGSETLRFEPSYPTNVSVVSRKFIGSKFNYQDYNDFITDVDMTKKRQEFFRSARKAIKPYFQSYNFSYKEFKRNLHKTTEDIIAPYPEIPYTCYYLTRSFFSRHCGGAKSSMLMTSSITRSIISPFIADNILQILWGIHPKHLNSSKDGLTNKILKKFMTDFCEIQSNSHLVTFEGTVLKKAETGKQTINHITMDYHDELAAINMDYIHKLNIFNVGKIKNDFFSKNHKKSYIWYDLFHWFNYIDHL